MKPRQFVACSWLLDVLPAREALEYHPCFLTRDRIFTAALKVVEIEIHLGCRLVIKVQLVETVSMGGLVAATWVLALVPLW